jgi:hypothetical protein
VEGMSLNKIEKIKPSITLSDLAKKTDIDLFAPIGIIPLLPPLRTLQLAFISFWSSLRGCQP